MDKLYAAQALGLQVSKTAPWLPCLSQKYVQSQVGIKGATVWTYDKVYRRVAGLHHYLLQPVGMACGYLAAKVENVFSCVLDTIMPVNPINGKRHLVVPRSVEKWMGDRLFYPMATHGMRQTHAPVANQVEEVFQQMAKANAALLNPDDKVRFNYHVTTVKSSTLNAFAVPGGGVVVFTELVKELEYAIKSGKFKETTVRFADGSTATVDLTGVTVEDALAAVLGHEMTHIASRHSFTALIGKLLRMLALNLGRIGGLIYLKTSDKEYQELSRLPAPTPDQEEKLRRKDKVYLLLNKALQWLFDKVDHLFGLFTSRNHEYEADITGVEFSKQAGYNVLGALLLQTVLRDSNSLQDFFHRNFEFFYTHPYSEKRMRALFATIDLMDKQLLEVHVKKWEIAQSCYDMERSPAAVTYASTHSPT